MRVGGKGGEQGECLVCLAVGVVRVRVAGNGRAGESLASYIAEG